MTGSTRGATIGSRLWWGLVPLAVLLWGTGALVAASLPGLPTTPLTTLALVPGLDFVRDVAVAIAAGAIALRLLTRASALRPWAAGWAVVAAGLAALALVALRADLAASEVLRGSGTLSLGEVASDTLAGRALALQAGCLLLAAAVAWLGDGRVARWTALVLVLVAAAAPGFAGHAGLSGEHAAAAVAIALHAAAASVWVGGLAVVCALVLRQADQAAHVVPRYSGLALACVIVVAESGLLIASLTAGTLIDLLGTAYGSIVLAKAALLGWLVLLGWQQRRRVVDRLVGAADPSSGAVSPVRTMTSLAGIELVVMGTALAAAAVLARIGPPTIPGGGFAPLTLVVLGLAVPMMIVSVRPRGWRVTDALPEVAAVVLLIVMVEVGGVGLLRALIGLPGLVLEIILLVGVGWLAVAAARGPALVILGVGLPIALAASTILADRPGTSRMAVVAAVVAALLVALRWRLVRDGRKPGEESKPLAADDVMAG